jgi:hypothetical protein
MRTGVSLLRDALDVAIKDVGRAAILARQEGNTAAHRNISEKTQDLERMKEQVVWMQSYLEQPKYKGYFER